MQSVDESLATAIGHYEAGRLKDAERVYREVLTACPQYAGGWHMLGLIAYRCGKYEWAIGCISRAIELNPSEALFHCNLGNVFQVDGKPGEAIGCYRRAVELDPNFSEAHVNLGTAFQEHGDVEQAIACFRRALELKAGDAATHFNLGNAFRTQERLNEAVACYRRAVELKPDNAVAHNNLGGTLVSLGKFDEAIDSYKRAVELKSDYAEAISNLGTAFKHLGRFDESISNYDRALQIMPECATAHYSRSMLNLLKGDFVGGWPEYEWRWKTNEVMDRSFSQPRWEGIPLGNRTILLHAEQGLGDTIQFVRYAMLVKSQNPAATVVVECQRPLTKLLARCPGVDRLVGTGDVLSPFDVHSPLLSLPGIFQTSLETIPANVPYLFAEAALVARWRERLSEIGGLRVGINWRGRAIDRYRHIPLDWFARLARIPGVRLVSLQKDADRGELAAAGIWDPGEDLDTVAGGFMDTAAIMKNLDLVISSDTAVPHLAGALGVPVWVALPFVPDWRWLLDRSDSPWYPTMRLFRQKEPGEWGGVFEEMEGAVRERVGDRAR